MYEDDVCAMVSDLERSNALLIKWETIVKSPCVGIANGGKRLIETAVQEFAYISREQLGIRLLLSGELHEACGGYVVASVNRANKLTQHAARIAAAERVGRRRLRL